MWSAKWTGTLTPTESGLYRFTLAEAGIATLKIAGPDVRARVSRGDAVPRRPELRASRGRCSSIAGQSVPVEIDYSSKSGLFGQEIHFGWQTPSQSGIPAAVAAAQKSDVAIVFANDAQGEGMDRYSLELQGDQDQLINAVAAANRRTIVVLNTGGPVLMPWLQRRPGRARDLVPGSAVRRRYRGCAVRRR